MLGENFAKKRQSITFYRRDKKIRSCKKVQNCSMVSEATIADANDQLKSIHTK